jgi:preprotein translocase subunit SecY
VSTFEKLKKRKIVQWALAYVAGAWVVLQLLDVVAEPWGIGAGLLLAAQILLAFGFFATLVLAWYHGEKGRQRVSGPELLMLAALLVTSLLVALLVLTPQAVLAARLSVPVVRLA